MAYNPPANSSINFALKSYTLVANDALSFELATAVPNDALEATGLDTSAVSLGSSVLVELHALLGYDLSTPATELGTPTLTAGFFPDALEALSLTLGAAEATSAAMVQTHFLLSIDFTSGYPVFTNPLIDAALHSVFKERVMKTQFFSADRERVTGAMRTITSDHANIHAHEGFEISYGIETVADDGALTVEFVTGAEKRTHMKVIEPWIEGALGKFDIFEAPTATGGSAITAVNKNRIEAGVYLSSNTLKTGVSPTSGTNLQSRFFGGGGNGSGVAGNLIMDLEWVMAPSTKYVFRLTNLSGAVKAANLYLFWYEEDGA